MNYRILVIDPDKILTDTLAEYLAANGYQPIIAHDGEAGLKKGLNLSIDAIVMEILLPKKIGFTVLKEIREHRDLPIIILSSRTDEIDQVVSFECGADDYLTKPCNPYELLLKLNAILRRAHKTPSHKEIFHYDTLTVDCSKRMVKKAGTPLELTNAEFSILEILIKTPEQAFSKEELTEYGLGRKFTAFDRSIDVHISNLRSKLGENPSRGPWIKTVRGFGYQFNP